MKWLSVVLGVLFLVASSLPPVSGLRADPLPVPGVAKNMSVPDKQPLGAPRCGRIPVVVAGFARVEMAQSDVGEWCSQDRYCTTGYFCCGSGCCAVGTNCCERDEGCCPGDKPIGCGPKCYRNQADAQADGCSNWEVCGAPVR